MTIGEFLGNKIGLESNSLDLLALDNLGGKQVGNATFYKGLDECAAHIASWMPIYFLPIGVESGFDIGIHLRPSDVAAGRLAVMMTVEEDSMIEVAGSLKHYVYQCLAQEEGFLNEDGWPLPSFEKGISVAKDIFGQDFYQPGRYGNFTQDESNEIVNKLFGWSCYSCHTNALWEEDKQKKLAILEQGTQGEPTCMSLYVNATEVYYELEDTRRAAEIMVRSLQCFHHTSYGTDLNAYYQMGRALLEAVPDIFPPDARRDLATVGERERLMLVMALYQDEQLVEATKMLCDLCHSYRDYNAPLEILKKHYSKLGWDWALALCNLRSATWSPKNR